MPKVSIITPLFNKGPYVQATLESVLAQTLHSWELIVVDNGSTDNGPEVVRKFDDERISMAVSVRRGPGAARNAGLLQARGHWVLFLDADDLLEPGYLEDRLWALERCPEATVLAGCWEEFPDGELKHRTWHQPAAFGRDTVRLESQAIAYAPWVLHAALVRRSWLNAERQWPEELDGLPYEDAAFWFPVICGAVVAWSPRGGALYRLRSLGSRNVIRHVERSIRGVLGVVEHNLQYIKASGREPSGEQLGHVVRVLESAYRLGLQKRSRSAALLALKQAEFWLHQSPACSVSLRVRQWLGLRLFNFLRFGAV